jgi:hypothetical protein
MLAGRHKSGGCGHRAQVPFTQFTCFTGTQVQILTLLLRMRTPLLRMRIALLVHKYKY